jgi:predicted nucleic acid-binding protein
MRDRFFLDTNIFVYTFDLREEKKSKIAEDLIDKALSTGKGVVSFQVIQEFFNVAFRRFAKPLSTADAAQYLVSVFSPLLSVHSSAALYSEALRLHDRYRLSWYDSLIVAAAVQAQCDFVMTEDLQHGQRFGNLQVVNPFL